MAAPYSLDLRQRVVAAVATGMSCAQAARAFRGQPLLGDPVDQAHGGNG